MFWYLVLAHLLGDYPFQPDWLVANKRRTWALLLHGTIHFMFMFVLVGQVRLQLLPQLLTLTVAHVIVDAMKTRLSTRQSLTVASSYILDQAIHVVLISLTAYWIGISMPADLTSQTWGWAVILSGYVFVTYVWGTSERLLTDSLPRYKAEVIAQMWPRMISRAALFTLGLFLLSRQTNVTLLASLSLPYLSGVYRRRALVTDLIVTLATTVIVFLVMG
jgi:hypothetical protein